MFFISVLILFLSAELICRIGFHFYGLDEEKLSQAKSDAIILHPGPMNRGVEIDSELADDLSRSAIQEQVEMGVSIRMAVIESLIARVIDK